MLGRTEHVRFSPTRTKDRCNVARAGERLERAGERSRDKPVARNIYRKRSDMTPMHIFEKAFGYSTAHPTESRVLKKRQTEILQEKRQHSRDPILKLA